MCYASSCNPTCGDCRPKRLIEVRCPKCGVLASLNRDEYLLLFDLPHKKSVLEKKIIERGGVEPPVCKGCGEDLMGVFDDAVQPAECTRSQVLCGYPCGRRVEPYRPDAGPCPHMVPLGKLQPAI